MSFQTRRIHDRKKKARRPVPWRSLLGLSLVVVRPLYDLGKKFQERKRHELKLKRTFAVGMAVVVALAVVLLMFSLLIKLGALSFSSAMQIAGTAVDADTQGMTNILLLGQGDETGQDLTDTIIIASLDPAHTQSVSLLSLPRDLYFLNTEDAMTTEKGKLNALWRDERIALIREGMAKEEAAKTALRHLADAIGTAFGIPIHHTVMVDFVAFEQVIDAIGGVDVDVPATIDDTEYPGPNYTYETFHIDAGRQHLDGKTALKYARTRHTTSDFDRSARQQQLIQAALATMKESGIAKSPRKILELYGILSDHVLTDLKTRQLVTLADIGKDMEQDRMLTLQLNNVNGLYGDQLWKGGFLYSPPRDLFDGEFVMLPVSIPEFPVTWKQVQLLMSLYIGHRDLYLSAPKFSILNGGAAEGSASRLAREFIKFGFDVETVSNVPDRKEFTESHLVVGNGEKKEIARFFGGALSLDPEEGEAWKEILQDRMGDITIVLGENYSFQPFQDLLAVQNPVE